jgi:hypothetical protein
VSADTSNHQYVDRPSAGVHVADADRLSFTGNTFTQMGPPHSTWTTGSMAAT